MPAGRAETPSMGLIREEPVHSKGELPFLGEALPPLSRLESDLIELAKAAGRDILEFYGMPDAIITRKGDESPLTQADLAAHQRLIQGLERLTPGIPVLSEESQHISVLERQAFTTYWLLDPLDGTKEFLKQNDEFTVNIALIVQHQTRFGVVHAPALGVTYAGGAGFGARQYRPGEPPVSLKVRSPARPPYQVLGSRSHPSEALARYLAALGPHAIQSVGSSLKFCEVAKGTADLYPRFGPTSEWDTAAAQAVLEGAGGGVVGLDAAPLRYNTRDSVLNPFFLAYGDHSGPWFAPLEHLSEG